MVVYLVVNEREGEERRTNGRKALKRKIGMLLEA
jgi:hypothetical protein